jgi:DNA-binding MarR family transcriptional regulator
MATISPATAAGSRAGAERRARASEIIASFRATFLDMRCIGSERLMRAGISMAHFHVMTLLERHGEMGMSRIAELLDVSFSAATGLIDRIEERGFVERVRVADDRRVVRVRLTDAGASLLRDVELFKDDLLQRVLAQLDDAALDAVAVATTHLRDGVAEVIRTDPTLSSHSHPHQPTPTTGTPRDRA